MDHIILTDDNKLIIRAAYTFFLDKLDIKEYESDIKFSLSDKGLDRDCYGKCTAYYDTACELDSLTIIVRPIPSIYGIIECLAHEMVHAKQHITQEVTMIRKPIYFLYLFFIGYKLIPYYNGEPTNNIPYFERPEEIAAFTRQTSLVSEFFLNAMIN